MFRFSEFEMVMVYGLTRRCELICLCYGDGHQLIIFRKRHFERVFLWQIRRIVLVLLWKRIWARQCGWAAFVSCFLPPPAFRPMRITFFALFVWATRYQSSKSLGNGIDMNGHGLFISLK